MYATRLNDKDKNSQFDMLIFFFAEFEKIMIFNDNKISKCTKIKNKKLDFFLNTVALFFYFHPSVYCINDIFNPNTKRKVNSTYSKLKSEGFVLTYKTILK